jgi:hypothetical protein
VKTTGVFDTDADYVEALKAHHAVRHAGRHEEQAYR